MNDEYKPRSVWALPAGPTAERGAARAAWLAAAGLAVLAALLAGPAFRHLREAPPPPPEPLRSAWVPPPALDLGAGAEHPFGLAIAPDGRRLVFPAARDGDIALWLHDLRTGATERLPGTDGAVMPFWSPDGTRIGFFAPSAIRAFDVPGGGVSEITAAESAWGASWNAAGDLVFAAGERSGLQWRAADGSTRTLTTPDAAAGETAHLLPAFLDDGRHIVFVVRAEAAARRGVWLTSSDAPGVRHRLTNSDVQAITAGGRLIYASDSALVSQAIDAAQGRLTGPVDVLGLDVGRGPRGQLMAAASAGTLIFAPTAPALRQLVWMARDGGIIGAAGGPGEYGALRIAPDGRRVAVTELAPQLRTLDVMIIDGARPVPERLSRSTDADDDPAWSPDGLRVAWTNARRKVMVRGAGAVLPEETIATFDGTTRVTGWTPDGSGVIVSSVDPATREDIWLIRLRGDGAPRKLVATPFADVQGTMSPDGRWLAYASDESGMLEVYVERAEDRSPEPATRVRVTSGGGSDPRWRRDGRELFFRRGSEIHAAMLAEGRGQIEVTSTSMLFETEAPARWFDATSDGRRFLLNLHKSAAAPEPARLLLEWSRTGGTR